MTGVLHDEDVRAITETAGHAYLRACPFAVTLLHAQMEIAICVDPCVIRVICVGLTSPVVACSSDVPVVSTEVNYLRNDGSDRFALDGDDRQDAIAYHWQLSDL